MAVFGLEVPAGDVAIPARPDIPAAFRITMAAIDPSAEPEESGTSTSSKPRATLKLIRQPLLSDFLDEDDSDFDEDEMNALLAEDSEDDDSEEIEDDEVNGGPSDPSKSLKARKAAAAEQIRKELENAMELDAPNGIKGKGKAVVADEEDDEDDEEDDDEDDEDLDDLDEPEEFVICTLDPEKTYQQPIDITIGEDERVWFKVSGTHTIYLTGNYVEPQDPHPYDDDEDEEDYDSEDEYDLTPDEDEIDEDDLSEDELDDLVDPRITEVESEEEAPVLIAAEKKGKGKNKRAADDSAEDVATLDDLISKANGETKLSKKQAKKLKNNAGQAVTAAEKEEPASTKGDKKVQFAEKLETGPTPSPATKDKAAATGPRVVQGVTIDTRKPGQGAVAKKGDRVSMRYIGKLQKDGKVFDSNKKGKPFTFKLGAGEVIKGWDIAGLDNVRSGSEHRWTIPAHLGYGSKGAKPDIPGNATLIFDVKVLEIKKA